MKYLFSYILALYEVNSFHINEWIILILSIVLVPVEQNLLFNLFKMITKSSTQYDIKLNKVVHLLLQLAKNSA
jgi:uncharacterized protein YqhQ